MRMTSRAARVAVWGFSVAICVSLALGGMLGAQPRGGGEIRFGAIVPSSGPFAEWGKTNTIALRMLERNVNASGGVAGHRVVFVIYDDAAQPQQSASLVRKLASDDRVLAIAGPLTSSTVEVAFPVCNQLKIVCVSQASSKPGVAAKNRPYGFRNTVDEGIFANATVPVYKERYRVRSAAVIYDSKDAVSTAIATRTMPAAMKKYGITVLNENGPISFQTGDVDVSAQVTKIKSLNPDGVVIGADYSQAITVIREMRRQGFVRPIIGGSPLISSAILQAAPDVPIIAPATYYVGVAAPRAKRWTEELLAEFKKSPELPAGTEPNMYDANITEIMEMFIDAVTHGGVTNQPSDLLDDRARIMRYLTSLRGFEGLVGPVSFNKDGDAVKKFFVVLGEHGKWTPLKELCSAPGGC
jgi:branched-chain amino acid transport system substrate-binding protein